MKYLQVILEKPMNRKQFLGYIGAALLAMVGVSGMIKALLHHESSNNRQVAEGYGSTAYGGANRKSLFS